jgi:hypothetical protein
MRERIRGRGGLSTLIYTRLSGLTISNRNPPHIGLKEQSHEILRLGFLVSGTVSRPMSEMALLNTGSQCYDLSTCKSQSTIHWRLSVHSSFDGQDHYSFQWQCYEIGNSTCFFVTNHLLFRVEIVFKVSCRLHVTGTGITTCLAWCQNTKTILECIGPLCLLLRK